jgi:hypothetical protein
MTRPGDESVPTPRRGDATRSDAAREARLLERRAERAANRAAELAAQAEELRREGRPAGSGRLAGVGARDSVGQRYYYRRSLGLADLATAAGIGLGAAVAAFYMASVLIQRTPLEDPRLPRGGRPGRGRDAGAR